jgi:hypothetical protein
MIAKAAPSPRPAPVIAIFLPEMPKPRPHNIKAGITPGLAVFIRR